MRLTVLRGHSPGQSFELPDGVSTIGRGPHNRIVLDDTVVSARHASIVRGLDGATIEDLGSTNGTAVVRGTERLVAGSPGELVPLEPGDVVELGSGELVCRLEVTTEEPRRPAQLVSVRRVDEVGPASSRLADAPTVRALYEAQCRVGRGGDLDTVLGAIGEGVFQLVRNATHVTIVLRASASPVSDGARGSGRAVDAAGYVPVLTRSRDRQGADGHGEAFVPVTRSVYRKVLEERTAVLAADAPKEVGASASIMSASVRSTIAVPLWRGEEMLGVLQVDNRHAPGMLNERDLELVLLLAAHASLAVSNARLIGQLRAAEERLRSENRYLRSRARQRWRGDEQTAGHGLVGESPPMRALLEQIERVAATNVTVLIEGETGSGKELVAAAIHEQSRRREKLFVAQNCAAISESLLESELFGHKRGAFTGATEDKKGLFELADGGTLFLDEVTEAPPAIQSKLLRALQEGEIRAVGAHEPKLVHVRVVAATNRDLDAEVAAGRFREDLYYRLKVYPVWVPPLRERRADIPLLARHFLDRFGAEFGKPVAGLTSEAMELLASYGWPGNVRELQNELQRLVIQAEEGAFVTPDLLSPRIRRAEQAVSRAAVARGTLREMMTSVERHLVQEALREHGNNKTATARALGITREGLHKKLRALGLE